MPTRAVGAIALSSGDSVLIVQHRLPIRLRRAAPTPTVEGAALPPPLPAWTAEWDEEAMLTPQAQITAMRVAAAGGRAKEGGLGSVRVRWIGTPPLDVPPEEEEAVSRVLEVLGCTPVFLPPATARAYYEGFCRDTLWPIFHNVMDVYGELPTRWWLKQRQSDRWKAYMDANQVRMGKGGKGIVSGRTLC